MKQAGHGLLLATIAISMFLDGLDGTIVNVALPDISESFGMDSSMSSWIVTGRDMSCGSLEGLRQASWGSSRSISSSGCSSAQA